MIVQCKECNSTFDINENKIPDSGAKLKCNGCENNIEIEKSIADLPELTIEDLCNDDKNEKMDTAAHKDMKQDTNKCQSCGENISSDTDKCKPCSMNIKNNEMVNTSNYTGESLGVFMLFIPLIAAALNWLLVPSLNIYQNPNLIFALITMGTIIITATLAAVEANKLGFGNKMPGERKESGPIGIFVSIILLWIFAYPYYLYQRNKKGKRNYFVGGIIVSIAFLLSVLTMSASLTNGFSQDISFIEDQYVTLVKESKLNNYPHKTIDRAIDDFMGNPKWESITGSDGNKYVNVTGAISYDGKKAEAALQFKINQAVDSFEINALEFNGISQNVFMIKAFLDKMYD